MHESIYRSILSTDIDLRRCFLGNIVLSGNILVLGKVLHYNLKYNGFPNSASICFVLSS